jgi:cytochrome c oxidase accessory protein FixG
MATRTPAALTSLSIPRKNIVAREVSGRYTAWRWRCICLTQLVYFGLPWIEWNGRPAVLFDLGAPRFYLFGLVLWPQDLIYLAGLLILCAVLLFLLSAVAGRVWCSIGCPHTAYTEIFAWIEHRIEGRRSARLLRARQPLSAAHCARLAAKHLAWIAVALWTGITLVAYFVPVRLLLQDLAAFSLGHWATFWFLSYALLTYLSAGWMREQVCQHLCAYARFQSAMADDDTLLITYDRSRGEPRGARRSGRAAPSVQGACIDCSLCAQVCPAGIDVRSGSQYACIDCAACIDACDTVMDKTGAPRGLVRYASARALRSGTPERPRAILRLRVLAYAALLGLGAFAWTMALATRAPLRMDVTLDRSALGREVGSDAVENVYRVRISNSGQRPQRYILSVAGMPGSGLRLVTPQPVDVDGSASRLIVIAVRADRHSLSAPATSFRFELAASGQGGARAHAEAAFYAPVRSD